MHHPSAKKQITLNSPQMPDKTSKDHPKTLNSSGILVWLAVAHAQIATSTRFLFTIYMRIVGTGQQALLLKLIDVPPSPCTRALHFY